MKPPTAAKARDKILFYLKTKGPQTAAALAKRLGVTPMAVRQHLSELLTQRLVAFDDQRGRVGRPARFWRVAPAAAERFPDSHGELAVSLIQAARSAVGEEGLNRIIADRMKRQAADYRKRVPGRDAPLHTRVSALAAIRSEEGYMAECARRRDGSLLLIENHCPICDAAESCQGLCAAELELFSRVLGSGVGIERSEHIVSGDRRCVYRIFEPRK